MTSWAAKTWFITGGSSGIGRALAARVIRAGGRVAVTARDASRIDLDLGDQGVALDLDLADPGTFAPALAAAEKALGPIDVLVNNAGYGLLGAIEETGEEERRAQMEANFFGPTALTGLVLPGWRARGAGMIVNVSSVSGVLGAAGSGYYAASKHALEGWSDALRGELRPFSIHVLVVEPGAFRTGFFARSRRYAQKQLGVYPAVDKRREEEGRGDGRPPGDPERGALAIVAALDSDEPPAHLVLGRFATAMIADALERRIAELELWREVSEGADFRE
ncbi:SDR family NAD(P)-dependent oxidoreductase [Streptomyces iranensis]|uniref:NAD(P)-dependent dehydrogenase (Short-subunit alcohol dehydrogenase family) n=1 Tax=Streptomyces iranensis TaxID=576784 RepID=A0A061A6D4_9ACTN|nr:SDR family NAD(P)-dependent oxidoreductase [Streptomyces iranensis]MBP2063501.1 NAD(P)-dependent dehydrogenase (short-subunit alcohol dehydrogenase family) [Streptomyces iranensis]CDR17924.1 short-chain dehydrogenase/reductase SDR [Streptomyces iranensis]